MNEQRVSSIIEEVASVVDLPELKALWCFGQAESNEYGDALFVPNFKAAVARLRTKEENMENKENNVTNTENKENNMTNTENNMDNEKSLQEQLAELIAEIAKLKAAPAHQVVPARQVAPMMRGGKRYRLLSFNVGWSSTPQVHAIARILSAHAKEGDIMDESDIVKAMEANVDVLATVQGGKRIWDYYKGKHDRGLMAHGNIELA